MEQQTRAGPGNSRTSRAHRHSHTGTQRNHRLASQSYSQSRTHPSRRPHPLPVSPSPPSPAASGRGNPTCVNLHGEPSLPRFSAVAYRSGFPPWPHVVSLEESQRGACSAWLEESFLADQLRFDPRSCLNVELSYSVADPSTARRHLW